MLFSEALLPGVKLIRLNRFNDDRGSFVKTFARTPFLGASAPFDAAEEFYSLSKRGVIRGMHFQLPPHAHTKLIYCAIGSVLDVLLDLRAGPGYGRSASTLLSAEEPSVLLIPAGVAHGFLALVDDSLMVYKTSTEHAPTHDSGVRWDTFGFGWGHANPIISERDRQHSSLADFATPF